MRRVKRTLTALAGVTVLTAAAPLTTGASAEEPAPGSAQRVGDITHVASVPFEGRGSDLEFASREVVKLSGGATGEPVCERDAESGCVVDENGDIVFQTEVRDFVVVGVLGQNARVVDITDPDNPVDVTGVPCTASQNDIQIQGDVLLVSQDGGTGRCLLPDGETSQTFNGSAVLDFSDPRDPRFLARLQYERGSHNHTFHPTEPLVYLSDSDVANPGLGNIPIWDVSDPANPVLVTEFQHLVHSPHDITFNADGTRAYAAAVSATYILNTEDPRNPSVISTIANEGISISHQSDPTPDGKFLLVSDEVGGGAAGVPPGGPVHVYDIRNEQSPVKIGAIWHDCVPEDCQTFAEDGAPISTAHVFRINPDGFTMAISWYKDGVGVLDYSGIRGAQAGGSGAATGLGPRTIAWTSGEITNSWASKMWQDRHPGYLFASDIGALQIFFVPELGPGFLGTGSLSGGNPAVFSAGFGVTRQEFEANCDFTPATQGVDGWVARIPSEFADGTTTLTARGTAPGDVYDLDLYFYDADCTLLESVEETGDDEAGVVPQDSAFVLVANFVGGPTRIHLSVR